MKETRAHTIHNRRIPEWQDFFQDGSLLTGTSANMERFISPWFGRRVTLGNHCYSLLAQPWMRFTNLPNMERKKYHPYLDKGSQPIVPRSQLLHSGINQESNRETAQSQLYAPAITATLVGVFPQLGSTDWNDKRFGRGTNERRSICEGEGEKNGGIIREMPTAGSRNDDSRSHSLALLASKSVPFSSLLLFLQLSKARVPQERIPSHTVLP